MRTCLWFDTQAEEAAEFYVSVFPHSKITEISRYGPEAPEREGTVLTVAFVLDGDEFLALNGGPQFSFTEAVSFIVDCADQDEVDRYWDALTADGGEESMCGWLKDRFGLSWQVVPTELRTLLGDPDPARAQAAVQAMFSMRKIDIAGVRAAADS